MVFHTDFLAWCEPAWLWGTPSFIPVSSWATMWGNSFQITFEWVSCTLWDASEMVPLVASLSSILTQDIHGNQAGRISLLRESNTSVVSVEFHLQTTSALASGSSERLIIHHWMASRIFGEAGGWPAAPPRMSAQTWPACPGKWKQDLLRAPGSWTSLVTHGPTSPLLISQYSEAWDGELGFQL